MKHQRLFQIVNILLCEKQVTASLLANKLEVSERTIYRDIETLSLCGIPVFSLAGKNGGISLVEGYKIDSSFFTKEEQEKIVSSLKSNPIKNYEDNQLIEKISALFSNKNYNNDWIEVDFSRWGKSGIDNNLFATIKSAIQNKNILSIQYVDSYGNKSERKIKPIKIIFKKLYWYLQSFCIEKEDFRTFKINRISNIVVENEKFNDCFDFLPRIDEKKKNLVQIELKVSQKMSYRLYDDFSHEELTVNSDNSVTVHSAIPYDSWILGWVLSFGKEIEIINPPTLRKEVKEYLNNLNNFYKS